MLSPLALPPFWRSLPAAPEWIDDGGRDDDDAHRHEGKAGAAARAGVAASAPCARPELAAFLRSRRARVTQADLGMPPGLRRRTPGLRREEVAQLSSVGVTWYAWQHLAGCNFSGPCLNREVLRTFTQRPRGSEGRANRHVNPLGPLTHPGQARPEAVAMPLEACLLLMQFELRLQA